MKRKLAATFSLLVTSILFPIQPAFAEAKWNPITDNDYIYGYTSYKYSCWSGVTADNPPVIEVLVNNNWMKVATGQILPSGSDLKAPCESKFPIAVGYTWAVLAPAPPGYQTNRYAALFRQRIPDTEFKTSVTVIKQVYEDQEKCCVSKLTSQKVPYIATVKKNGKSTSVIKYRTIYKTTQETYIESVLVDRPDQQETTTKVPGYITEPGNIYIYSSTASMTNEILSIGRGVLCSFGFTENCKK